MALRKRRKNKPSGFRTEPQVVRPIRFHPEILVRALTSPGTSEILENLFTSRGDLCVRVPVSTSGLHWSQIVRALMEGGIGTAIGYEAVEDGAVRCNPPADTCVDASALHLIVREGNLPSAQRVAALLERAWR